MSREWYIRTDKRNIQSSFGDIDVTPLTPKEKWQKNKGKYILWAVELVAVIAVLVFALPPLFRKNPPDYTVTVVTQNPIPTAAEQHIPPLLLPYAVDRDGDKEVEIAVRALAVGDVAAGERNPALETLIASFYTDEYTLFAMEPDCYQKFVAAYTEEGSSLFEKIDVSATTDGSGTLLATEKSEQLPALWWGVRALPNAKDAAKENAAAHKALLEALTKN